LKSNPFDSFIYIYEQVYIPPKCEILVKVTLNQPFKEYLFVINYDTFSEATSLFIAKGILDSNKEQLYVALAYLGVKNQVIWKGTIVGRFEILENEDINVAKAESGEPNIDELFTQLKFDRTNFSEDQVDQIEIFLSRFTNLFGKKLNNQPIISVPYRCGEKEKEALNKQLNEMLDQGAVKLPPKSPLSFPVV
jgi:hypothetical protein